MTRVKTAAVLILAIMIYSVCSLFILDNENDKFKARLQEVQRVYESGDTEGALATYTSLVDYDDTNSNAYYLRGVLYLSMQNNAAALADFSSAVANTDASYELYLNIYQQLTQVGLSTEAQDYLDKALELKGKTADDYFWRGRIYQTTGKYEDAIEQYKAAIDKKKTEANLYLAQVYEAQGDTDTAETYYQAYIDSGIALWQMNEICVDSLCCQSILNCLSCKSCNKTKSCCFKAESIQNRRYVNSFSTVKNRFSCRTIDIS